MRCPIVLATSALLTLAAGPVLAIDGGPAAPPPGGGGVSTSYYEEAASEVQASSYYEEAARDVGAHSSTGTHTRTGASAGGLPTALHVVEAAGGVEYRSEAPGAWEVAVTVAERPHERVDAVYDLVLALALPEGGTDAWRIGVREGSRRASAAAVYAGEKVSLKRNVPLEASWLPLLVGAPEGLPDLAGSGYAWTLWDTIVRYDASAGSTVQGFATLRFAADPSLEAPDPEDPRSAAYVITWIPALGASVPPFTLRLDVAAPAKE